ncbi:MAG TPA: tRNA lysidine(34) synthetase TilS [Firmicutes bacterium]|nr:tRNA lysidine(34) synthetase TilS [Bacillota bacterium]
MDLLVLKTRKFIKEHKLVSGGDKVLLAISGGPDSMALLEALFILSEELKISLHVVHLNHRFREEAQKEAEFVREKAQEKELPATILEYDVPGYRDINRLSSQEAARQIRYRLFRKVALETGANRIAVAHHSDDQVETLLLNLIRGTGLEGLKGMQPERDWQGVSIIRPFLALTRKEIESYLAANNIESCLDKSNLKETYFRNKIRLRLLPLLEREYNPNLRKGLLTLSRIVAETEAYMDEKTEEALTAVAKPFSGEEGEGLSLNRRDFLGLPLALQSRVLRKSLACLLPGLKGLSSRHIGSLRRLASGETGASINLAGGLKASLTYNAILITREAGKPRLFTPVFLPVPGRVNLPALGLAMKAEILDQDKAPWPPDPKKEALLDYEAIRGAKRLLVRRRRPGDRFRPLGLAGSKKLKDYFIDKKIPRAKRDHFPLVMINEDIVWVAGLEIGDAYKIKPETKKILRLVIERDKYEEEAY